MRQAKAIGLLCLVCPLLVACIVTYRNFPEEKIASPTIPRNAGSLFFRNEGLRRIARESFARIVKQRSPFQQTEAVESAPLNGLFVLITEEHKLDPLDGPLYVYAFVVGLTLTVLPIWATENYGVTFDVYRDGAKIQTYQYDYAQKTWVWILLLPASVVNASTYSRADVLTALTNKFFEDAASVLGLSQ